MSIHNFAVKNDKNDMKKIHKIHTSEMKFHSREIKFLSDLSLDTVMKNAITYNIAMKHKKRSENSNSTISPFPNILHPQHLRLPSKPFESRRSVRARIGKMVETRGITCIFHLSDIGRRSRRLHLRRPSSQESPSNDVPR